MYIMYTVVWCRRRDNLRTNSTMLQIIQNSFESSNLLRITIITNNQMVAIIATDISGHNNIPSSTNQILSNTSIFLTISCIKNEIQK